MRTRIGAVGAEMWRERAVLSNALFRVKHFATTKPIASIAIAYRRGGLYGLLCSVFVSQPHQQTHQPSKIDMHHRGLQTFLPSAPHARVH